MSYAETAIQAAAMLQTIKTSPQLAWERAARKVFIDSTSSRDKPCPKNTFLAICETGKLKGVKSGNYTNSDDNKRYAIKALRILFTSIKTYSPSELWAEVLKSEVNKKKTHNSQMHVVIALFKEGFLS